jgi:hypothetical protein
MVNRGISAISRLRINPGLWSRVKTLAVFPLQLGGKESIVVTLERSIPQWRRFPEERCCLIFRKSEGN